LFVPFSASSAVGYNSLPAVKEEISDIITVPFPVLYAARFVIATPLNEDDVLYRPFDVEMLLASVVINDPPPPPDWKLLVVRAPPPPE
jgi:hypothetical protein